MCYGTVRSELFENVTGTSIVLAIDSLFMDHDLNQNKVYSLLSKN